MAFHVEYTAKALADIEETHLSLTEKVPEYAVEWFNGLFETIDTLEMHPNRCALAPEGKRFHTVVRQLLYGKARNQYRILFEVVEERVIVLRVRHSARKGLKRTEL